jgi:D-3-phosphoglycerate dehydrogenase / 2-oxoglutarate reductase
MARIFLTHIPQMRRDYYGPRALAALQALGEVVLNPGDTVLEGKALAEAARGCEIIVSDRMTPGPASVFENAPDLVAFLRVAVDIRNIDVPAASRAGVLVTQATPGFMTAVVEMTLGFMIDLARNITHSAVGYRGGNEPAILMGRQLAGSTLGVMGYGAIGVQLAQVGVALGMNVLVSDPFKTITETGIRQVELPALLRESDFVVCLVVANEETENLMNAEKFALMKPSAFFINMSRGNLVDEAALERALDEKRIAGAAMDVGRAQDQKPSLRLAQRADVLATPHTAGLTPQSIEHQAFDTVKQAAELLAGRIPPSVVNADAAHRLSRLRKA